jgi:hypothetical protein
MAGFSFVAADNPSLGPTLRDAARSASREFTSAVEEVPRDTVEGQYLRELLMAAVSFAAGLTRRQQERAARIAVAEQDRELDFRRIIQTQRLGGVLRGGIQLLVLGGFVYALVNTIFSARVLAGHDPNVNPGFASLATALASALIGGFAKAWWMGYKVDRVEKRYKEELAEAKRIYLREATQEYEYAAQEANLAWHRLTGEEPPMTDAFRVLILSLLAGGEHSRHVEPPRSAPDTPASAMALQ